MNANNIVLSDDGTLDTVLICRSCGVEARYNFDGYGDDESDGQKMYDDFVEWAIDDFAGEHDCRDNAENYLTTGRLEIEP